MFVEVLMVVETWTQTLTELISVNEDYVVVMIIIAVVII